MYCKTAQNDAAAVRGARNYPCQEFPGKRAPTVALCRDPKGYVPIGTNPWRGPPIPYGTPMTNGLNILPPNKYPVHSAGQRPGSGNTVAGSLPPGVIEGPGPAPTSRSRRRRRRTPAGRTAGRLDSTVAVSAADRRYRSPRPFPRRHRRWDCPVRRIRRPRSRGVRRPVRLRRPTVRVHHLRRRHRRFPGPLRWHWYLRARKSIDCGELGGPHA